MQLPLVSLLAKTLLLASATLHPAIASAASSVNDAGIEAAVLAVPTAGMFAAIDRVLAARG
jgi:hypothetical protein